LLDDPLVEPAPGERPLHGRPSGPGSPDAAQPASDARVRPASPA
jgi:hypothetical protein